LLLWGTTRHLLQTQLRPISTLLFGITYWIILRFVHGTSKLWQ
jgi:hypothetical protein